MRGSSRSPTATICASRRVEYTTSTCFCGGADAAATASSVSSTSRSHNGTPNLDFPRLHLVQKSTSAVILTSRGVMIASGCSHVPPGTNVGLYDSTALEFSAL